jgi:hypothetical protein
MTTAESKSVRKLKRPLLWLVLVIVVGGFANWTEQRLDDSRAREFRVSQGPNSEKRIAGTQPPTSAALLLQLRLASAMLEPSQAQQRHGFSQFNNSSSDPSRRDSRDDQLFTLSNPRTDDFDDQRNSRLTNPFSSRTSTSPYVSSPNSGFGQSSSFGQSSGFGQSSSFGQSTGFGQNSSYGQSSAFGQSTYGYTSSRTNTRNQSDTSSGLLGSDNPN